ncbi:neuraminidase-like domain-containing protein [Amycolatopsis vancoresmycina]|uniref:Insecticidal toxin complex protein n=1 Tax=Amycolatopsis vancoresmycina DSM 44592 TaxID=1292037 RepID=R1HTF2_9PSEU|nr:neuraminidase-like domain-containing protein [Amycolatopsis vancoresmycina]EOD63596.1 insecticidal toxin complex protein [Amycolatopsis vancoresmycina DSM 44592]
MPDLIVVKLHPTQPVPVSAFRQALNGLTVTAFDLAFGDSTTGVPLGSAKGLADAHVPAGGLNPSDNSVDLTKTQIIQHYADTLVSPTPPTVIRSLLSAASAVIVANPPSPHPEYPRPNAYDLRLELSRNGTPIVDRTIDFNIAVVTVASLSTDQRDYLGMAASAYATLPTNLGKSRVDVPQDGTAPPFGPLVSAIDEVLAKDPGDGHQLAGRGQLTAAQSLQIASELTWDRTVYPPPAEPRPLGVLYTKPDEGDVDQNVDSDRKKFEGQLTGYHATHDAEAARLAKFVYSASAAVQCERLSAGGTVVKGGPSGQDLVGAPLAAFPFPVIAGGAAPLDTAVILEPATPTLKDLFVVPAAYFYALAVALPVQVGIGQRYDMARFDTEPKILQEIQTAIDAGSVLDAEKPVTGATAVTPAQAARRLHALGTVAGSLPEVAFDPQTSAFKVLVTDWLARTEATPDLDRKFWPPEISAQPQAYLDLVLQVVTQSWTPLITEIAARQITSVDKLVQLTDQDWRALFGGQALKLLPPFTQPGTPAQRVEAFIRHLRKFFTVPPGVTPNNGTAPPGAPMLDTSAVDVFARFAVAYSAHGGGAFTFTTPRDATASAAAVADTFPDDADAQAWLTETLDLVEVLYELSAPADAELRFSVMEALYARGFVSKAAVQALTPADFAAALTGTVAYPLAPAIQAAAGGSTAPGPVPPGTFRPVDPDGSLTDCRPPSHLSPFGPVAYLHELLLASAASAPGQPTVPGDPATLGTLLTGRRGPLGELHATHANTETPLPALDLVNESLEKLTAAVATGAPVPGGAVHDTASGTLAGHPLRQPGGADGHDPATLFAAIPEHSSPAAVAVPADEAGAYAGLRNDFTAPVLPYDQPLDVNRSYLGELRTSRFSAMRHFRREITEFVLDPAHEPDGFDPAVWRYPVRFDIAREYLGVSAPEYDVLFAHDLGDEATEGRPALHEVFGFPSATVDDRSWTDTATRVGEFLRRTGLTYCEFLELQQAEFVCFTRARSNEADGHGGFPACEPCDLDDLRMSFGEQDTATALRELMVFVRLWRHVRGHGISLAGLAAYARVLHLFDAGAHVNSDFLRRLAAALMLARDLRLPDAGRLLPLWDSAEPDDRAGAVALLLDAVEDLAEERFHCRRREPEFLKVIAENLDRLSVLAGFDPGTPADTWSAQPTHTLRFVEVLGKIYASDFSVGEILFLFTTDDHLDGDDPFPLQDRIESADDPLSLPETVQADGDHEFSLWKLRRALLDVEVGDEEAGHWSWQRIVTALREQFGYGHDGADADRLLDLGKHFFAAELRRCGCPVDPHERRYRVALPAGDTCPHAWIAPPDGPFGYDETAEELWTELPLRDSAVIERLRELWPLNEREQFAVRDLYFAPRAALAPFAAIFGNFDQAVDRLVQEPDEHERFAFFRREFALFHRRCEVVATHLAAHVRQATGDENAEPGTAAAWRLLRTLLADENFALTPWEDDSGEPPPTRWAPRPGGGAFAAVLGLTGTGLLGEFEVRAPQEEDGELVWRETRGPLSAFGPTRNALNAPVPTVLPALDFELTREQLQFAGIRNGFAFRDRSGEPLGGAQPFAVTWSGVLLIEERGEYRFHACLPGDGDARHNRWRVTLGRGQKSWTVLNHHRPGEPAPAGHSRPVPLRRGAYRITVEFEQTEPDFSRPEDDCPARTGFELKYSGPDSGGEPVVLPFDRLFRDTKDATLGEDIVRSRPTAAALDVESGEAAAAYLTGHYPPTLRDIRRTYQRAFKALLFAERFRLSAHPVAGYRQSELGFLLDHPATFEGTTHHRTDETSFSTHHAWFAPDLLPVSDHYPPETLRPREPAPEDQRSAPSPRRQAALFDWWERVFDYTRLREATERALERPPWLLFADALEQQPDDPGELLRHLGVDLRHAPLVLNYFAPDSTPPIHSVGLPGSAELADERWAVRIRHAESWVRRLRRHFLPADISLARPALWAADDPSAEVDAPPLVSPPRSGNADLTRFVQDGCLERGEPRRYENLERLDDGLRERAREALLAYLCGMRRVPLPWAPARFATEPRDLSDLLLQDVQCGITQRVTRIEDAVTAVQAFVQRARLGLEPGFAVTPRFAAVWEHRFGTFRTWVAARRREVYRENWIEWDDLRTARRSEAFRFLEDELRRTALTVPVPGGLEWWPKTAAHRPPGHPGLPARQVPEPAGIRLERSAPDGLGLLGTPERVARPSWLAPVSFLLDGQNGGNDGPDGPRITTRRKTAAVRKKALTTTKASEVDVLAEPGLPLWLRAAEGLGSGFVRLAAAGLPTAAARFAPRPGGHDDVPPEVDEYYFWVAGSGFFAAADAEQNADAGAVAPGDQGHTDEQTSDWHRPGKVPGLLNWDPEPQVHLYWSRFHHGEFEPPRRSAEGLAVAGGPLRLKFDGRTGDSLRFEVTDLTGTTNAGTTPDGYGDYAGAPPPGFRYDLAADSAVVLPLVAKPSSVPAPQFGLAAYPFFAYVSPGAPLLPPSVHAVASAVAKTLRTHNGFEAALRWYELAYPPLARDNAWTPDEDDAKARDRAVLLDYLETLLQWGETLLCRDSAEASRQAAVVFDSLRRLLGAGPRLVEDHDDGGDPQQVATFVPARAPLNPRLASLYERSADRLALVRNALDGRRLRGRTQRSDAEFWGDAPLRDSEHCDGDCPCCATPYRFGYLIGKAVELANEVRGLGAALLSAYEKGDAEALAALHATHERQLLELALQTRRFQWREADWQVQALNKTKDGALTRLRYFQQLIARGLNAGETGYEALTGVSMVSRTAGNVSEAIAQGIGLIPDIHIGVAGLGPLEANQLPIGTKLANATFATAARIMNALADIAGTGAGLSLTEAGWQRRLEDWQHQLDVTTIEVQQIERQILAAERHRDSALRDLNSHQRQLEHSAEVQDFLRGKFTNGELYTHLQSETAALHRELYELALRASRQAQRAFNNERGHLAREFLPERGWDSLHEGLLAGDRLHVALRQMELAYTDANCREYELTKHLSLRLDFPAAFLRLQTTGAAEIELPEWLFDLDHPGHYLRRIKNVTLSIPCVVGPYVGVHCRLTLLSSTTRVDPRLSGPVAGCCGDRECRCGAGYRPVPDDPRLVHGFAATEAIATSSGQNDSGLFELGFRDERYLPFEFSGAVSRWRLELPPENNRFDFDTLADVVLHLNYTAREGGDVLRKAANDCAQRHLPGAGVRLFDVRHDFPDDWYRLTGGTDGVLPLVLGREHFPFLPAHRRLRVTRLELFAELDHPGGRGELPVRFVAADDHDHEDGRACRCAGRDIHCVTSAGWPSLVHGDLDVSLEPGRSHRADRPLGVFHFPATDLRKVFLLCHYELSDTFTGPA